MARPYYAPGRYWGKIVHQALSESSNGNPQVIITFEVIGAVNPDDPDGDLLPCGQRNERSVFQTITDKTVEWVTDNLRKLGFTSNSFADIDLDSTNCCDLRNREAPFWCDHEAHYKTGDPVERWKVASDGNGLQVKPLAPKGVRQLDAMFGKYLKQKPVEPSETEAFAARVTAPVAKTTPEDISKLNEKFDKAMDADKSSSKEDDIPW